MRLIVHGGMPKTGSTLLRQFLSANAETLANHGILYPTAGRHVKEGLGPRGHWAKRAAQHHAFFLSLIPSVELIQAKPYRPLHAATAFARMISEEVRERDPRCVLLSSEYLFYPEFDADALHRMVSLLGLDPIEIFLVLRRQDRWAASLYAQRVKGATRYTKSFEHHVAELEARGLLDYPTRIEVFERVFGSDNLHLCWYERLGADPVGALLARVKLKTWVERMAPARSNVRPSWAAVRALRVSNTVPGAGQSVRRIVTALDGSLAASRARTWLDAAWGPDPGFLETLRSRYAAGNAALSARFPAMGPPP